MDENFYRMVYDGKLSVEEAFEKIKSNRNNNKSTNQEFVPRQKSVTESSFGKVQKRTEVVYEPEWIEKETKSNFENEQYDKKLLIVFSDDTELVSQIRNITECNVLFVKRGKKFSKTGMLEYTIDPVNEKSYTKLFHAVKEMETMDMAFVNLWNCNAFYTNTQEELERQLEVSIYGFLAFQKALQVKKRSNSFVYLYVCQSENPISMAMSGFIKSMNRDNNQLSPKLVGLSVNVNIVLAILKEVSFDREEIEVHYKDNKRYIKSIKEVKKT